MTQPVDIQIRCADCGQPATTGAGRCIPCQFAHGISEYATQHGIDVTVVRHHGARARVTAHGADGRPAWLDTLSDVRYLAADLAYTAPPPTPLPPTSRAHVNQPPDGRWAHDHDACAGCTRTDRPHRALGYCTPCYFRQRRRTDRTTGSTVRMAA